MVLPRVLANMVKSGQRRRRKHLHVGRTFATQPSRAQEKLQRSTIFALSTPPGVSAVAVVRVSGPHASSVFHRVVKGKETPPDARKAALCWLRDPETSELLDRALVLWFPSPNSFTGEDVCELHIHGGIAVVKSVLRALQKLNNFRFAEPGEFTKRAFVGGKMDLTEVEGLSDLLQAETEAQQRQALRQAGGALSALYGDWAGRLKRCLAQVEAYIDFSEDQHLNENIFDSVAEELSVLKSKIAGHLQDKWKGEKLRSGVSTVIIGRPNVGKSSLLNNLCKRDIAIVSPSAGTTRDLIETSLNLGGYLVNICDTAGIRASADSVEQEGVRRAKDRSSKADLIIFMMEAGEFVDLLLSYTPAEEGDLLKFLVSHDLGESFQPFPTVAEGGAACLDGPCLLLLNKVDLLTDEKAGKLRELRKLHPALCAVSCTSGEGMAQFVEAFSQRVSDLCCGHSGEEPAITQERHRLLVESCLQSLQEYENAACGADAAIAAEHLRRAMCSLGRITGQVHTEEILDVIFSSFCIGK